MVQLYTTPHKIGSKDSERIVMEASKAAYTYIHSVPQIEKSNTAMNDNDQSSFVHVLQDNQIN